MLVVGQRILKMEKQLNLLSITIPKPFLGKEKRDRPYLWIRHAPNASESKKTTLKDGCTKRLCPKEGSMDGEASKELSINIAKNIYKAVDKETYEEHKYFGFDKRAPPEKLFAYVLMFVPPKDVVLHCSLVCKHWLSVSRDQSMWRRKCEEERKYMPGVMGPPPDDFMRFYFKNPYGRNLLRNTHARDNIKHWQPLGGMAPTVQSHPNGAFPIADYVPASDMEGLAVQNWVTSYWMSSLKTTVSLLEEGCSEAVLDGLRPPIHVSAWCAASWDCGSQFKLEVNLLDVDKKPVDNVQKEMVMIDHNLRKVWHRVHHTFKDYTAGVRSVLFCMGGQDTQFWAGNYGAKFTLPCVRFVFDKVEG